MKKYLPLIAVGVITLAVVLLTTVPTAGEIVEYRQPPEPVVEPEPEQPTEPDPPPEEPTEPVATEPDPVPEPPELMTELLDEAGYTVEDIPGQQVIIVKSSGNTAEISAYERDNEGAWSVFLDVTPGHVGRNGVSAAKVEGDGMTPMGLFPLPSAFGVEPDPGCLLPYRQTTSKSYWVDDPNSASYNQWVEDDGKRDWKSAEHLSELKKAYAFAAVIGYNLDPIVPGAGSAIFLHVGSGSTAGCVALAREELLKLLLWLDPKKSPRILIF